MGTSVEIRGISKSYVRNTKVLNPLDLTIASGELFFLLGSSGCGKSTLLRIIAGLLKPDTGSVLFNGNDITNAPPEKRKAAMVFQNYALWPHMSVFENIAFGLQIQGKKKAEIRETVMQMLELVRMTDCAERRIQSLSGGQQQRIALARALAVDPAVLLLDEPLSNLDAKLRLEMRYELQRLHVETGSTFVYVTHDQMEAMTLATQICLMNNGVLQQYAAPLEVYNHPANLFAADFVGNPSINFVEAKGWQGPEGSIELTLLDGHKAVFTPEQPLQLPQWFHRRDEELEAQAQALKARAGESGYVEKSNKDETFRYHIARVNDEDDGIHEEPMLTNEDLVLGIRPEFLSITGGGNVECEIYGAMPTGMESTVKVRIGEYLLTGVVFGSTLFTIGSKHLLDITGSSVMLFDRSSGRRITSGTLKLL